MNFDWKTYRAFVHPKKSCRGNPGAVTLVDHLPETAVMQEAAREMALPACTFLAPRQGQTYSVRWFAPEAEIDLCGHGSLMAMTFVQRQLGQEQVELVYRTGSLRGGYQGTDRYFLQWEPIAVTQQVPVQSALAEALGIPVQAHYLTGNKDIVLVERPEWVCQMQPNFDALRQLPSFGYAVTAAAQQEDFVSRTLVPKTTVQEDAATGSSHAALFPFWANRLKRRELTARQCSRQGGYFTGSLQNGSLWMQGRVAWDS